MKAFLTILLLFSATYAIAFDVGVEVDKSKGDKKDTQSEQRSGESVREGIDTTIGFDTLFAPVLLEYETQYEFFKNCHILSRPALPSDFGFSAEREGVIDVYNAQYLSNAAASNASITTITGTEDAEALERWSDCLLKYGAFIGQAITYLNQDISSITSRAQLKDYEISLEGFSLSDMQTLANMALEKALAEGLKDPILGLYNTIKTTSAVPCRFNGSTSNIACGSAFMTLSAQPTLIASGIVWYGNGTFAGKHSTYRLSQGAEDHHSKVMTKRQEWAKNKKFHLGASISRFIKGLN